jgi:deoxyribonuclease-4
MRSIGLHLRLTDSFVELIEKALRLKLTTFQSFLTYSKGQQQRLQFSKEEIKHFVQMRRAHFKDLYAHASYWVNLANKEHNGMHVLAQEITLAKRLEFTHLVVHPGNAHESAPRLEGINVLAYNLNELLKKEKTLQFVLENTAHGNHSIGGNLEDFELLLERLDEPERIKFCIDTAHAYSFGYDLCDEQKRADFIALAQRVCGNQLALLHVNDTQEKCGSKIDKHAALGLGALGDAIPALINDPYFVQTPIILELPVLSEVDEVAALDRLKSWV